MKKTKKKTGLKLLNIAILICLIILAICFVGCDTENEDIEESSWSIYLEENIDKLVTLITIVSGVFGGVVLSVYKVIKCIREVKLELTEVDSHKQSFDSATKVLEDNRKLYSETLDQVTLMKNVIEEAVEKITSLKTSVVEATEKERKALYLALTNNGELVKKGVAREIGFILEDKDEEKQGNN